MRRVLVTGGAEYTGSHTVRKLKNSGYEVIIYGNLSSGHEQAVQGSLALGMGVPTKLPPKLVANSQKAGEILGWKPNYDKIEDIIKTA